MDSNIVGLQHIPIGRSFWFTTQNKYELASFHEATLGNPANFDSSRTYRLRTPNQQITTVKATCALKVPNEEKAVWMLVYGSTNQDNSRIEAHIPPNTASSLFANAINLTFGSRQQKNYMMVSCDIDQGAFFKALDGSNEDIMVLTSALTAGSVLVNNNGVTTNGNIVSMINVTGNDCVAFRFSTATATLGRAQFAKVFCSSFGTNGRIIEPSTTSTFHSVFLDMMRVDDYKLQFTSGQRVVVGIQAIFSSTDQATRRTLSQQLTNTLSPQFLMNNVDNF